MIEIPLTKGHVALIDDEDYAIVGCYKWLCSSHGYAVRDAYCKGTRTRVYLHRKILNAPVGMEVDHINGNKLDNRRSNLRLSSHMQNLANQKKRSCKTSSRYKGVYWDNATGKWRGQVKVNGKAISLGRFQTEREAAIAYNNAAIKVSRRIRQSK